MLYLFHNWYKDQPELFETNVYCIISKIFYFSILIRSKFQMDKNLKIMLAQLNPIVGDLEKNSKIILETYKKACKNKVDILAFPEMFLSGYQIQDLVFRPAFQKYLEKYIR